METLSPSDLNINKKKVESSYFDIAFMLQTYKNERKSCRHKQAKNRINISGDKKENQLVVSKTKAKDLWGQWELKYCTWTRG